MKIFFSIILLGTLLWSAAAGQSFEWKGLKLEAATPTEALALLGKPRKEKIENISDQIPASTRAKNNNQTTIRKMFFKKIDDFEEVFLTFYNEKLVEIKFSLKKKTLPAKSISNLYNADFLFIESLPKNTKVADFEGQKETTVPKIYPGFYSMLSVRRDVIILASVDNNSWKAVWRDATGKPTVEMFPGYITDLQIVSRSLEEK